MRILYVTTQNPKNQGDLLEISVLHGLREVLGDNCIDYPKKKIMYGDFSESPKDKLHGRGFSLLTTPIKDVSNRDIFNQKFDVVLYGDGHMYGEPSSFPELNTLSNGKSWIIDGHDLYGPKDIIIGNSFNNCFKRELIDAGDFKIFPTGFGIPVERIKEIDFSIKDRLYQKTAPFHSLFEDRDDRGGGFSHHKFSVEEEYYYDLSRAWFGLSCKKGGWDCLRHYEIIAAGAVLLFRDFDKKPKLCSPQDLPAVSYSTKEQLKKIIKTLVVNNKPTEAYLQILQSQRNWLYNHGTTAARAKNIVKVLGNNL